jgi:DNA-binding HxlR family transcriptional regulator
MRNRLYTCGVDVAVTALGGRWRTIVLARIKEGTRGFAELRRQVPGISEKMLSAALRDLMTAGFIQRNEVRKRPLEVQYVLTPEGKAMAPALTQLNTWGEKFADEHGLKLMDRVQIRVPGRRTP